MVSLWILLLYVMADVMGRGHGGDGAEDPPPPFGRGGGQHEMDLVSKKNTRGVAKNLKLTKLIEEHGGPLPLTFDLDATLTPVGRLSEDCIREVGIYMWASIPFDKGSWDKVDPALRAALIEHLRGKFNISAVEADPALMKSLHGEFQKLYRGRKAAAKKKFLEAGGYDDVPKALANPPMSMDPDHWKKAIDYFHTDEHRKRSVSNKECRAKQEFPNRGGSCKFSSAAHKENKPRVEVFRNARKKKDGTLDNPQLEQQLLAIERAYEECRQQGTTPNDIEIFEKVLGSRRGHTVGIGRKPSQSVRCFQKGESSQPPSQSKKKDELDIILDDPHQRAKLLNLIRSVVAQHEEENDESEDQDTG